MSSHPFQRRPFCVPLLSVIVSRPTLPVQDLMTEDGKDKKVVVVSKVSKREREVKELVAVVNLPVTFFSIHIGGVSKEEREREIYIINRYFTTGRRR